MLEGLIDDVRIFGYPLDPVSMALMYTDMKPREKVCLECPSNDYIKDCKVDILDFVEIISAWLECNRIPQDHCTF